LNSVGIVKGRLKAAFSLRRKRGSRASTAVYLGNPKVCKVEEKGADSRTLVGEALLCLN